MNQFGLKKYSKYFFIGLFVFIILLSFFLIRSYITSIFGAILLTYIFYPIYKKLLRVIRNKTICSLIVTILVLIILMIPIIFATNAIINESVNLYYKISDIEIDEINNYVKDYFDKDINIGGYVKDILNKFSMYVMKEAEAFIWSLPEKLIAIFVIFFIVFYAFKDGKRWIGIVEKELPLEERYKKNLSNKFKSIIYATIYGIIVTGILVGALGALGFYIFGLSSPILWGIIMTILSMLPLVGTCLVWLPAGIYLVVTGNTLLGVLFLLYNWIIVSGIDTFVRPKIIGAKGKLHPVFVLLGIVGGLKIFGLIGVIIGPLIFAILTLFFEIYISEKHEIKG